MKEGNRHDALSRARLVPEKKEKYRIGLPDDTQKRETVKREGWHNGARVKRK